MSGGRLVISLDFELMWGMRDHVSTATYGDAVAGGREAIPEILRLFAQYDVAATWATVGFLMARNRDELFEVMPAIRPRYRDPSLDPYPTLDEIGRDEAEAPLWFGASLVDRIVDTPRQEIGTHSFSHYCALEPERDDTAYLADLRAAVALAGARGLRIDSIVFARNQYSAADIATAATAGISCYRGMPGRFAYTAQASTQSSKAEAAFRLIDSFVPLSGTIDWAVRARENEAPVNVPGSRFLRPVAHPVLQSAQIARIRREMNHAAQHGRMYHLWWHPHNFGRNTHAMLAMLETILRHYRRLNQSCGFESWAMRDMAVQGLTAGPA